MKNTSASKTPLLLSGCTSWLDPRAEWEDITGPAAEKGNIIHKAIEDELTQNPEYIPTQVHQDYVVPAVSYLKELTKTLAMHYELAVWVTNDGIVGQGRGRGSYPETGRYFSGTADIVACNQATGGVLVLDWKTGNPWKCEGQLKSLASLLLRLWPHTKSFRLISACVEVGKTWTAIDQLFSSDDADKHMDLILESLADAPSAHNPGVHCFEGYCPHRTHCSALNKLYTQDPLPSPGEHNIRSLIPASKLLTEKAGRLKDSVEDYVRAVGGVTLDDGRVYTETYNKSGGKAGFKAVRR